MISGLNRRLLDARDLAAVTGRSAPEVANDAGPDHVTVGDDSDWSRAHSDTVVAG